MAAIAERPAKTAFPRWLLVLPGVLLVVIAVCAAAIIYLQRSATLVGTTLNGTPAPPFTLTDQDGRPISLGQFRGQPVALTFLYTQCPDACPLIADELRQASDLLGPDAARVGVLAVSTDPVHDTRVAAVNFTQVHGMSGRWHYLLGSPEQLSPVWQKYYIGVTPADSEVTHSEAVYLIDKAGRERVLLGLPFSARDLASDLKKLLAEN